MKEQQSVAEKQILVIEDDPEARKEVVEYLDEIDVESRADIGVGRLNIDEADAVSSAKRCLTAARTPYDLVLLDLRLPLEQPKDGTEDTSEGQALLEFIQATKSAKGVVVVSAFDDYKFVRPAFTGGAIDYVGKPIEQETFEPVVLNALSRLMIQDTERLLNQRVFDLVAHAQLGLAHGFRQVFFTLLRGVTEAAEGLEKNMRERYPLDSTKDPIDSLALLLNTQREAIAKAREDWAKIQAELAPPSSEFDTGNVSEMLAGIKTRWEPALVVKRVNVTESESYKRAVHTFEKDVEIVLGEIIGGALSELGDAGQVRTIKISFITEATRVGVVFEDDLDPIPEKHAQVINEGLRIINNASFGRVWGLSVAQHVALRGGGEISIATKHGKNVTTYYIPLADHA